MMKYYLKIFLYVIDASKNFTKKELVVKPVFHLWAKLQ